MPKRRDPEAIQWCHTHKAPFRGRCGLCLQKERQQALARLQAQVETYAYLSTKGERGKPTTGPKGRAEGKPAQATNPRNPSHDSRRAEEIRRGDDYDDPDTIFIGIKGEYE